MSPLLTTPLLAFVISLALHAAALKIFPRLTLLDFPERYGLTRLPIPYPTGLISVILFLCFFGFLEPRSMKKYGVLLGVVILGITCFIDDRRRLSPVLRSLLQLLVILIIFLTGTYIFSLTNPLPAISPSLTDIELNLLTIRIPFFGDRPIVSGIFTIIWLGLTVNALNWFDGIPGQVSVVSVLAFLTIGFLSLSDRVAQPHIAMLAFTLAAITTGSLIFNLPPPKMLIGDTGAMFYGLMIGILTIYSGGKVATAFLVLGVPLIDSMIVVLRRIRKGTSIMKGNATDEHLHHRLLRKGWSEWKILFLTCALGTGFGVTALFLSTWQKAVAAILLFCVMLGFSAYSRQTR